ncbi:hypothetical protein DSECCO2_407550 [anaerobic digester metagenome]
MVDVVPNQESPPADVLLLPAPTETVYVVPGVTAIMLLEYAPPPPPPPPELLPDVRDPPLPPPPQHSTVTLVTQVGQVHSSDVV